jgi:hypothetical protein
MRRPPYASAAIPFEMLFDHAPPSSIDLLSKMLRFSAAARISMFDARSHKFHDDSTAAAAAASPLQFPVISDEEVWFAFHFCFLFVPFHYYFLCCLSAA